MDINTRLDGFIIHPLDAFNDRHHDDTLTKFSNTAPNLDGFQVHPLDNFISQEHNNDNNFNEVNNLDNYIPDYTTNEIGNTYDNVNSINLGFEQQPQIQDYSNISTTINNDYTSYNQYETYQNNSSTYPITYTEPINYTSYDTYTPNQETNYINSTSNYTSNSPNYDFNTIPSYTNYNTTDYNYSKILPPKFLPTINSNMNINSGETINLKPIVAKKIIYSNPTVFTSDKSSYQIPSYNNYSVKTFTPVFKFKRTYSSSQVLPVSFTSLNNTPNYSTNFTKSTFNNYQNNYKPTLVHYNTKSSYISKPNYKITSFTPEINWNKIIPKKTTIVIPTIKKYIIPKKTQVIIPKKQSVIIQKPVILQPKQTIQIAKNTSSNMIYHPPVLKTLSHNIIVPTITISRQNIITTNVNQPEKFPMDNIKGKNIILPNSIQNSNIYYPKNFNLVKMRKNKN